MKSIFPYFLLSFLLIASLFFWHKNALSYKFDQGVVNNYLRSQDIEDTTNTIKDRVFVSDSDIYIASGYLYARGENPTKYNFQHPPLVKYLYGFSIFLTGNPFYVQMFFGFLLLFLTYFLGTKLFKSSFVALMGTFLLLIDPVFQGMQTEALLDLGQAVFALSYLILMFFYPKRSILIGVVSGAFAASKFWSTALIVVALVYFYKLIFKKEKLDFKKTLVSFVVAFVVFLLVYLKSFIGADGSFNVFSFLLKDLRFMLSHNSAGSLGGPIILFLTGVFAPWWKGGVIRAADWSILWPIGLIGSIWLALKTRIKDLEFFFYILPLVYLIVSSTQVPFTRYFILILPFVYLNLTSLLFTHK